MEVNKEYYKLYFKIGYVLFEIKQISDCEMNYELQGVNNNKLF